MSRREKRDAGAGRATRATTVAGGLSRTAARQLAWYSLFICLSALLLAGAARCWEWERAYLGPDDHRVFPPGMERSLEIVRTEDGRQLVYRMKMEGMEAAQVNAGPFFSLLAALFFAFALFSWLLQLIFRAAFATSARRALRPFDELAARAQQVSELEKQLRSTPPRSPAALHELESAIGRLSPTSPGAHIDTGESDLAGLETAINDLLQRTREAYQQQTRFVSDASHELRTPIAVIKGYADMLERWGKDDRTVLDEGITAIRSETAHMSRLVEQLLFLARGDSGRTLLRLEPVDLSALVREVYEESEMIHPGHRWRFDAVDSVETVADAQLLKQAVRILVDNAVKYTPPAGDTPPSIRLRARYGEGGAPCIEVQDSGVGIASEDVQHVFERFFRADPARAEQSGSGLGLAIAKWIVDRHGGYFEVISRREIGTRITICLPESAAQAPGSQADGAAER